MLKLTAREIMSEDVHEVSPLLRLIDLESDLSSQRISGAPVVEGGKVVGIVSRSDIQRALSRERSRSAAAAAYYYEMDPPPKASVSTSDPTESALQSLRTLTVRDVMTHEIISVSGDQSLVEVAALMRDRHIHRVLVLEDEKLLGIVSSFDIVSAVADLARPS